MSELSDPAPVSPKAKSRKDPVLWGAVFLSLALLLIDLQLPLGVAGGIPYVTVVLLTLWSPNPRLPLTMALLCTLLILIGLWLSPPGGELWVALVNRGLSLLAIWAVGLLVYLRRQAERVRLAERREAEEKLRLANRDLEAFARTLSHDLRSYLTPIISFADFLREQYGECLQEQGREVVGEIEAQGERMLVFLEDLLQLAQAGNLGAPSSAISAEAVVENVLRNLEERARQSGLEVRCGSLPEARIPETLLSLVFSNLVANALHYAGPEGGPVEIGGERTAGRVRYFVRDYGPGIPPPEREDVFEVFYRGAGGRKVSGTGIGLATVRRIAQVYQGRAWVDESPGGGCTVWIELFDGVSPPRKSPSSS